ncbi:triose-phosphate isomerase [Cellvibrio japonicus]|uniref:Triosephosphate isomerase n=1 Tax=Cellvibrio japonicus (strain Ueda107) TaxID=498211 RepID=B3PGD0_CELJU|nr:triose-phosphate isomerase [Cellvibrio japonicus]ACE82668.1 triosephosphate isomerase [Cellvibrio japonicus Ueda107]QEI10926.1 triose-phosphate isomerase [Cellvibrio japonicus]QEI14502.1 triose-phosphate isomerase [Cellvibrio japonicus]QEI18080.1 triose-phosphate isomerase [Cellvibrio japonicus]
MKPRKPIVIANWKLNGGLDLICTSVASFIGKHVDAQIAICPPYLYMRDMMTFLQFSELQIGSQNVSRYESGAYTGETSAQMLKQAGCSLCLIGHSERRAMFAENNEGCQIKVRTALNHGLLPVLCVGENQAEREANITEEVLYKQLSEGLANIELNGRDLCIAYEPVWAIGTGLAATPAIAQSVHQYIRAELARIFDADSAARVRILYGGSVNKTNARDLLLQEDIDGLLVGGASLDPGHFLAICEQASELAEHTA